MDNAAEYPIFSMALPPTQPQVRLVLVDTCSLVRLYYSDLKPVAGRTVASKHILTLDRLAKEVVGLAKSDEYAWLNVERLAEVNASVHKLTQAKEISIDARRKRDQSNWQIALDAHCQATACGLRKLSINDGFALAAVIEFEAILVTDEWPLKWVAENFDYDNGTPIESLLSVDILALYEANGVIDAGDRRKTYHSWRAFGESLHKNSDKQYRAHFGEAPPNAQS